MYEEHHYLPSTDTMKDRWVSVSYYDEGQFVVVHEHFTSKDCYFIDFVFSETKK